VKTVPRFIHVKKSTDVEDLQNIQPISYSLSQNYPNPFNPSTDIAFSLPNKSFVSLKVLDLVGREVATLMSQEKPAGTYQVMFDASKLPSGVYFYRLTAGDFMQVKTMLMVK
jgi:predicted methyltransferase